MSEYEPDAIYGNGVGDLYEFLDEDNKRKLVDVRLPDWSKRPALISHQLAVHCKNHNVAIPGCSYRCPVLKYHTAQIVHKTNTLCQRMRARSGFHCAFFDALEVYFYLNRMNYSVADERVALRQ